jgi:hypothetical protein
LEIIKKQNSEYHKRCKKQIITTQTPTTQQLVSGKNFKNLGHTVQPKQLLFDRGLLTKNTKCCSKERSHIMKNQEKSKAHADNADNDDDLLASSENKPLRLYDIFTKAKEAENPVGKKAIANNTASADCIVISNSSDEESKPIKKKLMDKNTSTMKPKQAKAKDTGKPGAKKAPNTLNNYFNPK